MSDLLPLLRQSLAGLRVLVLATLVLGVAYPVLVWGISSVAAPWRAHGSLITESGRHTTDPDRAVGSELVGQLVEGPDAAGLFLPRASAAGEGYDMLATAASNLGPESPELLQAIQQRRAEVAAREGVDETDVPPDAVTASASGLDPHISPAYAELQVARVARESGLSPDRVRSLVDRHTAGRTLGVLGEPRVDVLALDIAVRAAAGV